MKKNERLDSICRRASEITVSEEERLRKLRDHFPSARRLSDDYIKELLSELDTVLIFERIEKEDEGVEIFLPAMRFPKGRLTREGYEFSKRKGRSTNIVVREENGCNVGEIDLVVLIDGYPIIVETHLGKYYDHSRNGTAQRLMPGSIDSIRIPIAALFSTDPAMVFRVPPEQVAIAEVTKPTPSYMHDFVQAGGYIIPFYTDRKSWLHDATRMAEMLKRGR